jgi:hypothetical protein
MVGHCCRPIPEAVSHLLKAIWPKFSNCLRSRYRPSGTSHRRNPRPVPVCVQAVQFAPARAGYPADYGGVDGSSLRPANLLQQHNRGALRLARAAQCTALSGFVLPVGDGGVYLGVAGG